MWEGGDVFCLGTCFVWIFQAWEWPEIEWNSASSVTTLQVRPSSVGDVRRRRRSDGYDTLRLDKVCLAPESGWTQDKKDRDN